MRETIKWLKTSALAAGGGGMAAALTAAFDPMKYNIRHDLGSGKLWEYFAEGFVVTLGALLIRSPLGQRTMQAYKDSQEQAAEDRAAIEKVKADLKGK